MNVVRIAITAFIAVLITIASTGWVWVGSHQTATQATASRVVLTICIAAGVTGVVMLWRPRPPN